MNHTHINRPHEIRQVRRFRANPIEVVFLSVISLIFINSVYSLVYDHHGFSALALRPMASHPNSEGRALASVTSSLLNFDFDCEKAPSETTSATRIRIMGPICGFNPNTANEGMGLPKVTVKNRTNRNTATVFSDNASGKFSTDYISLEAGENIIYVEVRLGSGKPITREIRITKVVQET